MNERPGVNERPVSSIIAMSLVPIPLEYFPTTDGTGRYVDMVPASAPSGISCPCGSRKNYAYTRANFRTHIQCDTHRRWVDYINSEQNNYYQEAIQSRVQIKDCQIRIAIMQKEIQTLRSLVKKYVREKELEKASIQYTETTDLIDFSNTGVFITDGNTTKFYI